MLTYFHYKKSNGFSGPKLQQNIFDLRDQLIIADFPPYLIFVDGDPTYENLFKEFFETWYYDFLRDGIDIAAFKIATILAKPSGDFFHFEKNHRSKLMKNDILFVPSLGTCIAKRVSMENILHFGRTLNDLSSLNAMRESYCLHLYFLPNVIRCYNKKAIGESLFILPFACWNTAFGLPSISSSDRITLLELSFNFFDIFYRQSFNHLHPSVGQKSSDKKNSVIFMQRRSLIRILCTLINIFSILKTTTVPILLD